MLPTVLLLVVGLGVLCSVTGLVMMWVGATGVRRMDRCGCGYDLRGLSMPVPCCPECGHKGPFVMVKYPRLLGWGLACFLVPPAVVVAGIMVAILSQIA